jgi:hypothetical protein
MNHRRFEFVAHTARRAAVDVAVVFSGGGRAPMCHPPFYAPERADCDAPSFVSG